MKRAGSRHATGSRGTAFAAQVTPAAEGTPFTCPGATATEVNIDGAWLCKQPYVLCTTASCQPSESDPAVVICGCLVEDGYSFGYTTCAERAPAGETLISTFSTQDVTSSFRAMSCPAGDRWANCLDMPCQIDPGDPTRATCACQVVETEAFVAVGGDCDTSTCSSVIWSAAAVDWSGVAQYVTAMKCVEQATRFPTMCPSATPAGSSAGTPKSG